MNIPIVRPVAPLEQRTKLMRRFAATFGATSDKPFFVITVPLRVCPLGAHSDHQGGTVTGLTIDRSIQFMGQGCDEPRLEVVSTYFNERRDVSLRDVGDKIQGDWGNYVRGSARALSEISEGLTRGFRGVIHGAMPIGGLSSSAAVTIAYLKALEHVHHLSLTPLQIIMLVRAVENGYLGLHNGILDQSVIMSSKKDALTRIDCSSHEVSTISLPTTSQPWEILVVYSGLSRQLTATPFNQRVSECRDAARELLRLSGRPIPEIPGLREVGDECFAEFGHKLAETLQKRARHFFSEASRVKHGVEYWRQGDMRNFGALVTASGESSIVNFESGSPALISLYEILVQLEGVYGARFCGGGFQGCCLALIDPAKRDAIAQMLHEQYITRHPELAAEYSIHFCNSSDSVSVEVVA